MRDAVVLSGWTWEAWNVPERVATAMAHLGARVVYVENPFSGLRNRGRIFEVDGGRIFGLAPWFFGHRLNRMPGAAAVQAKMVAGQILDQVQVRELRDPIVFFPHGDFMLSVASELKNRGYPLAHICMDYPETNQEEHVGISDLTLVIPGQVYRDLREKFGERVVAIPQAAGYFGFDGSDHSEHENSVVPADMEEIPRPRLGYLGPVNGRIDVALVRDLAKRNPEWQFLFAGSERCIPLPNVHALPWRGREWIPGMLKGLDAGFMPYDCSIPKNLHCVPLKLFDYFRAGLPVVSTPILFSEHYRDVLYRGDNVGALEGAIRSALDEPAISPKRDRRIEISGEFSLEAFGTALNAALATRFPEFAGAATA